MNNTCYNLKPSVVLNLPKYCVYQKQDVCTFYLIVFSLSDKPHFLSEFKLSPILCVPVCLIYHWVPVSMSQVFVFFSHVRLPLMCF